MLRIYDLTFFVNVKQQTYQLAKLSLWRQSRRETSVWWIIDRHSEIMFQHLNKVNLLRRLRGPKKC